MSEEINDTLAVERRAPRHFSFSEPYWEGTRDRKLKLQYCRKTGQYQFYPRPLSIFTGTRDIEWREVSVRRTIFPVACVLSLFLRDVAIYAVPNNGGWYDFGYFLGIVVFGVGAHRGGTKVVTRTVYRDRR